MSRLGAGGMLARLLGIAVVVAVVSAVSVAAIATWSVVGSIKPGIKLPTLPGQSAPPAELDAIKGGVNVLLVGTDTREGQGNKYGSLDDSAGIGNNDVTMLLHIAEDHGSATVVSFPRDLMVPIPACPLGGGKSLQAEQKAQFNTTLQDGGLGCTVLTVEKLTGLNVPFAGLIKFKGVIAMSNAIGGVQVCVANRIDDDLVAPPLHMAPGKYTIKGGQALSFLRTRHGLSNGSDLARISNQQVFLSALVRKIKDDQTLGDPAKLYGLAKAATNNMLLSQSMSDPVTLVKIGLALKNIPFEHVLFLQYPVLEDPENPNRVVPDAGSAATLFRALKADKPLAISGTTGSGSIVATPTAAPPGPTDAAGASSTPAPTSGGPVELPENVHGQSAAERTCSNGAG